MAQSWGLNEEGDCGRSGLCPIYGGTRSLLITLWIHTSGFRVQCLATSLGVILTVTCFVQLRTMLDTQGPMKSSILTWIATKATICNFMPHVAQHSFRSSQDQVLLPMLESPPESWPLDEGDDAARLLTWRGAAGEADATLEGAIIMALRFVGGTRLCPDDTCSLSINYHMACKI